MAKKGLNMEKVVEIRNEVEEVMEVETTPIIEKPKKESKPKTNTKKSDTIDHKKTNGTNKKDNYSITFKIDADIEDYLKNILWINRKTKNEYVNDLIRADMIKRLNLREDATYNEIQTAWDNYKKDNNI